MDPQDYRLMAALENEHWWYLGRRRILQALIERLALPPGPEILEAGCGTGGNLAMLSGFGRVSGFEPDSFALDAARRRRPDVELKPGSLPGGVPFTGPFDMVCAFDVIEHVERDSESLRVLHDALKPGGYALFTVPAFMFLWSRHDETHHHFRRYTVPAFRALLAGAGFEVAFISYYNSLLFPAIALMRFAKTVLRREDVPDEKMPRWKAMNALLAFIFSSERHILKRVRLPAGVSIVAVCRRRA